MSNSKGLISLQPRRIFSEALKKQLVTDIEQRKMSIRSVCFQYRVSHQAVYSWLKKFSPNLYPTTTIVMQMDSEEFKSKQLEAALGRKQMEIDFLNKVIEIADEDLGTDIKKNISTRLSNGSEKTKGKKDSS
jgi:transposase-like protein